MTLRRRLIMVLLCVGSTACSDGPLPSLVDVSEAPYDIAAPPRDANALHQTDSLRYTLRDNAAGYEAAIRVRFTNQTGGTVYFVNCHGATAFSLEKLTGTVWRVAWTAIVPACLSSPITVPAEGINESDLRIFAGHPSSNVFPQFSAGDIPGIYRVVWYDALSSYNQDTSPFGASLPLEQRVSNRFAITIPKP